MNRDYIPYFYVIEDVETGKLYGGVEFGRSSKIANPNNILETYFTSSKVVRPLVEKNPNRFIVRKIKTFDTAKEATSFECRFLTKINAKENIMWYNNHNGHPNSEMSREKQIKTCNEKYGCDFPLQNAEVRKKAETNRTSSFCNPEVQKKIHSNKISPFVDKDVQNKARARHREVMEERYGVDSVFDMPEFKAKMKNNMKQKHSREIVQVLRELASKQNIKLGSGWVNRSDDWINERINNISEEMK